MLTAIGVISLLAWGYLVFLHHDFWKGNQRLAATERLADWPSVAAIIPARNEAESITASISSLMDQDYPGRFRILVADDSSTDGTAGLAHAAGDERRRIEVVSAPPLEAGWTGKLWALNHGLNTVSTDQPPDFIWFTDADIVHDPSVLSQLVSKAINDEHDLVSLMVQLHCRSFWERLLVPAFVFFFAMLYPFPAINDPLSRVAGAAGGCILIKRTTLRQIGGIAAIKDELIDDCALAAAVKQAGGRIWLGLADTSRSIRRTSGLGDLWQMVTRTAFTQLRYSAIFLAGTVAGLSVVFLAPPLLFLSLPLHNSAIAGSAGGVAWFLMAGTYIPTLKEYSQLLVSALFLPLAATLYAAMTLHSALNHWRGASSRWKDRDYAR